jgi:hypothetical protein
MKKNYLLAVISMILIAVIAINLVSAVNLKLLCLDKGDTIKFSKCNSAMSDRTCTNNAGCQFCVDAVSNGVYCPKNINECNSAGLQCSSMTAPVNTILGTSIGTSISIDNTPGSGGNNTNTNPGTGNNTNTDDGTIHLGGNTNTSTTNTQTDTTSSENGNSGVLGAGLGTRISVRTNSSQSSNLNSDGTNAAGEGDGKSIGFFEKAKNFLTGNNAVSGENNASGNNVKQDGRDGIGLALGVLFLFNIIIFVFLLNYDRKMDKSLENSSEDN